MLKNKTTVRTAGDSDAAAWNSFIDAAPESSPLARYEWSQIIRDSYGLTTPYFIAERNGRIVGTLGTYETKGPLGERSLYSIRCGLIVEEATAARALLDHVASLKDGENWSRVLVTSGWQRLPDQEPDLVRATVQLKIDPDPARNWSSLRDKTRNMVRRAEKDGVKVVSGLDQVDILIGHYYANMLRLGVAIHSRRFFDRVLRYLATNSDILVAWHRDKPIASMMLHYGQGVACYPFQNAVMAYRVHAPVQLLTWAAMKACALRNIRVLDMGESAPQSSVFRSKVNFGGEPRDIFYYEAAQRSAQPAANPVNQVRRLASVAEGWLVACSPLPVRRWFAVRAATRGRLM
jgi:serine/alanine adding enzyme